MFPSHMTRMLPIMRASQQAVPALRTCPVAVVGLEAAQRGQCRHYFMGQGYDDNYKVHKMIKGHKKKHKNEAFVKERRDKVMKVDLMDFHEKNDELTPQEVRMKMKLRGIRPFRPWMERPVHVASTPITFEAYIPPEGDGKVSIITKEGAKQSMERLTKKGKSYFALRKIYKYDDDFELKEFVQQAQEIYLKTHRAIADDDEDLLHDLVTERAFPMVTYETKRKTIRWQFVETLEPPRAVHLRVTQMVTDDNLFAQITVRMHTKQTMAVYDRFGHLMHGSEVVAKDVLEYVVYEKHITNTYGTWRLHDKIIPDWQGVKPSSARTYREQEDVVEEDDYDSDDDDVPPPTPPGDEPARPKVTTIPTSAEGPTSPDGPRQAFA